ncbi:hypothetical protein EON81_05110 [bacterium]|nr:MAG: hypothetical protein EON81_05110 [bacterium]
MLVGPRDEAPPPLARINPERTMLTLIASAALLQAAPPFSIKLAKVVDGLHPVATLRNLAKHPQPCYGVAWSNDGAYIATGDDSGRVWIEDARTGASVKQYRTHTRGVQKLSFDRTRRYLLSTGKDDAIMLYDLQDPGIKESKQFLGKGQNFYGGTFNPINSTDFVTGTLSSTGVGRSYDSSTGQVRSFLTEPGTQGSFDAGYNPAGTRVVTGGRDSTATLWDVKGYKKLGTFKGHGDWVMYVMFTPNGRWVISSSTDGKVRLWNPFNYQKVAEIEQQTSVGSPLAFTGDGKWLLTVNAMGSLEVHSVNPPQPAAPLVAPNPVKAAPKAPLKKPVKATAKKSTRD